MMIFNGGWCVAAFLGVAIVVVFHVGIWIQERREKKPQGERNLTGKPPGA